MNAINSLVSQARELIHATGKLITEATAETTAIDTYPTVYPEACARWEAGKKIVNSISNIALLAAVVFIANEIFALVAKRFRASTLPTLYFCAEVIVLSPAIKELFNNHRSIPFYFGDKELKGENKLKKYLPSEAQKDFNTALGDAFKKSLAYKVFTYIDSHLNEQSNF